MKKVLLLIFLMLMALPLMAEVNSREYTIEQLSAEVTAINQEIAEDTAQINSAFQPALQGHMYEKIFKKLHDLKAKYQNNPYIRIAGFAINIGASVSVSIAFAFKDKD